METTPQGAGERFLHRQDGALNKSLAVELEQIHRAQEREHQLARGEEPQPVHTKPAERIGDWLQVLEQTHGHQEDPRVLGRIKSSYHKQFVIKPGNIPEAVFELEARIARNMGHGDVPVTPEYRERKTAEIIAGQEQSLDRWVDYLSSPDATYPMWAKYWAFDAVTKMGKFEKKIDDNRHETARFATRTADTAAPFPPLNPRALALSITAIADKVGQAHLPKNQRHLNNPSTRLDDAAFQQLVSSESFSKLYAQFLVELPAYSAEGLRETRGQWVRYAQFSDPQPLVDSLEGHPLEWCTAGYDTARTQLQGGDFHVYYSLDEDTKATIPRVAIRMEGDSIAEVRGIAPGQNLDPYIGDVVGEKMGEFPDGEIYQRRADDMRRLTAIEETQVTGRTPSADDLRFLYEIDHQIEGFGDGRDPRIDEIRAARDARTDLAAVFDCQPEAIMFGIEFQLRQRGGADVDSDILEREINVWRQKIIEAIMTGEPNQQARVYVGDLDINVMNPHQELTGQSEYVVDPAEKLAFPGRITGNLTLAVPHGGRNNFAHNNAGKEPAGLDVGGGVWSLTSDYDLQLPVKVDGNLNLKHLQEARNIALPEAVGHHLIIDELREANGLALPKTVGGDIDLSSLEVPAGVQFPEAVGGNLWLGFAYADDEGDYGRQHLVLPESIGGDIYLYELPSADGVQWPETVGGKVYLPRLSAAEVDALNSKYPGIQFLKGFPSYPIPGNPHLTPQDIHERKFAEEYYYDPGRYDR